MPGRHRLEDVTMGQPYRPRVMRTGRGDQHHRVGSFFAPAPRTHGFFGGAVKSHRRTPRIRFW